MRHYRCSCGRGCAHTHRGKFSGYDKVRRFQRARRGLRQCVIIHCFWNRGLSENVSTTNFASHKKLLQCVSHQITTIDIKFESAVIAILRLTSPIRNSSFRDCFEFDRERNKKQQEGKKCKKEKAMSISCLFQKQRFLHISVSINSYE